MASADGRVSVDGRGSVAETAELVAAGTVGDGVAVPVGSEPVDGAASVGTDALEDASEPHDRINGSPSPTARATSRIGAIS